METTVLSVKKKCLWALMWRIINNNVNPELQNRGKLVVFIEQQTWIFQGNISFLWQEPSESPVWSTYFSHLKRQKGEKGKLKILSAAEENLQLPFFVWWFLPFLSPRWWREDIPAVFSRLLPDFSSHFLEERKKRRETNRVFHPSAEWKCRWMKIEQKRFYLKQTWPPRWI